MPFDPTAPLQFVVNVASGRTGADERRHIIEQGLAETGRSGELHLCRPREVARAAAAAAARAAQLNSAVVGVGGDGSLNAVARAAHAAGCAMGVVAQGTFNYFARTHALPTEPDEAMRVLATARPVPVQVAAVNGELFLVNASLGLYPELLQDREAYKNRFGRSRLVALGAALATLLRAQRRLRLHIELGDAVRDVKTLTLFVGNNRLQLEQVGLPVRDGQVTAVMLRPLSSWGLVGLMLRGAFGRLADAPEVEPFTFTQMTARPALRPGRRRVKVAFDGEVSWLQPPLAFSVMPQPLMLLKPPPEASE